MLTRVLLVASLAGACWAQATAERASSILQANCFSCHSQSVAMSGLRLDTAEGFAKGGTRGPASAFLLKAVNHEDKLAMPPGKKLPPSEIAVLREWVEAGAPFSAAKPTTVAKWWSFQAPKRPAVPAVAGNPIDAFVNAKLSQAKLAAVGPADARTLIRRATFDLHGLPPTSEQTETFVNDKRPDAYERLLDELLASPRYGEKWGRHWLDLVRYGDTAGFEQDPMLLYAWRYRDYVIESFNQDKPYDRFVKEQIAGDELYPDDPVAMSGTGFFTVGPNRDMLYKVEDTNRIETLTDYVDTTGSVFLGLTVGCARCHDHKFDPIPQKDYYKLQSIFVPLEKTQVFLQYDPARGYNLGEVMRHAKLREFGDQLEVLLKPYQKRISDEKLSKLPANVRDAYATEESKRTPEQRGLVDDNKKTIAPAPLEVRALLTPADTEAVHAIEIKLVSMFTGFKSGPFAPGVRDISREAPKVFLPARPGGKPELVTAGFLTALGGGEVPEPPEDAISTGRRKALAEWLVSPSNPLTARVMVNRAWQYHFGKGLVTTTSDFGSRGSAPTHPEMLEWLTTEFVQNGWSLKKLHKLMMTSAAYKRGVEGSQQALTNDPENKLLSHFNRRRLAPEEIRDAMLQSSGALNLKMGGRPVVPHVDRDELYGLSQNIDDMWIVTANPDEQKRRSVYLFSRRTFRPAMFESFDAPDGVKSCSRREASNTAPQSLTLFNGKWTVEEARRLGARVAEKSDSAEMTKAAWTQVLGRAPEAAELARGVQFLDKQKTELGNAAAAASELIRGLYNTNEFLYVD